MFIAITSHRREWGGRTPIWGAWTTIVVCVRILHSCLHQFWNRWTYYPTWVEAEFNVKYSRRMLFVSSVEAFVILYRIIVQYVCVRFCLWPAPLLVFPSPSRPFFFLYNRRVVNAADFPVLTCPSFSRNFMYFSVSVNISSTMSQQSLTSKRWTLTILNKVRLLKVGKKWFTLQIKIIVIQIFSNLTDKTENVVSTVIELSSPRVNLIK